MRISYKINDNIKDEIALNIKQTRNMVVKEYNTPRKSDNKRSLQIPKKRKIS